MTTPTTFTVYENLLYSGWILKVETPEGDIFGRTLYDPNAVPPGNVTSDNNIAPVCLGADGNLYTINNDFDGDNYTIDLVKWPTDWAGAEPPASSLVASAVVAGQAPSYSSQTTSYLFAGGASVQAVFTHRISGVPIAVALNPEVGSFVFEGCQIPDEGFEFRTHVVGLLAGGGYVLAAGGQLT